MRPESTQKSMVAGPRPTKFGYAPDTPFAGTPLAFVPWHDAQFCMKSASPRLSSADEGALYMIALSP